MSDPLAFLHATLDAAQKRAEAAKRGGDGHWVQIDPERQPGRIETTGQPWGDVVVYDEGSPTEEQAEHIAANDPAVVLRRIAADRKLIADLLAERHLVNDGDCWYTCCAATEERDGGETCNDNERGKPCDCGRDTRVDRRIRLIAEGRGWTEETT